MNAECDMLQPVQLDLSGVCIPGLDGHCAVCADEGLPGRVLALDAAGTTAIVAMNGEQAEVAIDLLDDVAVGDWVLVHLGFALTRLDGPA